MAIEDPLFQGEKFCTLVTGNRVSRNFGYVTVLDMAWQLGRIVRWTGAGSDFFSVMLHSFVVADLVKQRHLKCHALIHDSPECVGSDVPSPVKTDETRRIEEGIMGRTLDAHLLPRLSAEDKAIIKTADNRSKCAEAWVVGNAGNRISYPMRDLDAEKVVKAYTRKFHYTDTIERHGKGPQEFLLRFERYHKWHLEWAAGQP